jgi:hypothetical protein
MRWNLEEEAYDDGGQVVGVVQHELVELGQQVLTGLYSWAEISDSDQPLEVCFVEQRAEDPPSAYYASNSRRPFSRPQ